MRAAQHLYFVGLTAPRCLFSMMPFSDYPGGRLSIRYKGVELAYRTFDKIRQVDQGAIADNKRLGPVMNREVSDD